MARAPASKSTAVVAWKERLQGLASKAKALVQGIGVGNWLGTANGTLTYKNNVVEGNALDVVILEAQFENALYQGKYNPKSPQPPICYAFGSSPDEMAPHEKCEAPQSDTCAECPHNQWGTGDEGRGKACKNTMRIAAMLGDDTTLKNAHTIQEAEIVLAKVPVTSVRNYAGYVNQLGDEPPVVFVTEVSLTPDPTSQFKMNFTPKDRILDMGLHDDAMEALFDKADKAIEPLTVPYPEASSEQAFDTPPVRGGRAPARGATVAMPVRRGKTTEPEPDEDEAPPRRAVRGRTPEPEPEEAPARRGRTTPAPAAVGRPPITRTRR
jgi:hypothetical protein